MIQTLSAQQDWWSNLEIQWKKAFNESFFQKAPIEDMPDEKGFADLFSCPNFRFAGPKSFFPNLSFELSNLTGLEVMHQAELISVSFNQIADVGPLSQLVNLKSLFLNDNNLESLEGLEGLTKITTLYLSNNRIKSLKPLEKMDNLQVVQCSHNKLASFAGLHTGNTENLDHFIGLPNRVTQLEIDRLQNELRVRVLTG